MVKFSLTFSCIALLCACDQTNKITDQARPAGPAIKFVRDTLLTRRVPIGDSVQVVFNFQNTGNQPLKIIGASGSCSCTVAAYDKGMFQPGKKGSINVIYRNTGDSTGIFKVIVVETNRTDQPLHSLFLISK